MTPITRGRVVALSSQNAPPHLVVEHRVSEVRGKVVSADLTSAAQMAGQIVAEAEATAAARLEQFERDLAGILAEMRVNALADVELEYLRKALDLATLRQRIVESAQQDLVSIARLLAERILSKELTLNPEQLAEMARQILRESRGARTITIYASSAVAEHLSVKIATLATDVDARVNILRDDSLGHGDLRVETDVGCIDARIGTQLTHLATTILESIRS